MQLSWSCDVYRVHVVEEPEQAVAGNVLAVGEASEAAIAGRSVPWMLRPIGRGVSRATVPATGRYRRRDGRAVQVEDLEAHCDEARGRRARSRRYNRRDAEFEGEREGGGDPRSSGARTPRRRMESLRGRRCGEGARDLTDRRPGGGTRIAPSARARRQRRLNRRGCSPDMAPAVRRLAPTEQVEIVEQSAVGSLVDDG